MAPQFCRLDLQIVSMMEDLDDLANSSSAVFGLRWGFFMEGDGPVPTPLDRDDY